MLYTLDIRTPFLLKFFHPSWLPLPGMATTNFRTFQERTITGSLARAQTLGRSSFAPSLIAIITPSDSPRRQSENFA